MPKKILLADDSITIQKVVELTFSDGDYEVTAVNNGAKAIQKLAEMKPDIVLSDIIMPEKNGYEVCEYVKSHPELRHLPVILLTGTFEPFDPDRAEKAGCDAVVTKPFESQSLIHKVEELIAQTSQSAPASEPEAQPSPWLEEAPAAQPAGFSFAPPPPAEEPAGFSFNSAPPADAPFTHEPDIFGGAPAPEPQPPALESQADSPFGSSLEEFGGETRAFPRMTFDEMQRMMDAPGPQEPSQPEPPPPPAPSPWEAPAEPSAPLDFSTPPAPQEPDLESPFGAPPDVEEFSGETRAFPRMTLEDIQRMEALAQQQKAASAPAPAAEPLPWEREEAPSAPSFETPKFDSQSFETSAPSSASGGDSFDQPPVRSFDSPFETPAMTPAEPEPQGAMPWDEEPEAPAFGGETRAFPMMSFDELQKAASGSGSAPATTPQWNEPSAPAWSRQEDLPPIEEPAQEAATSETAASFDSPQFDAPAVPEEMPFAEPPAFSQEESEPQAAWSGSIDEAEAAAEPSEPALPAAASASEAAPAGPPMEIAARPGELTEEQVDRIARRVVELMSEQVVRNIAWEVIPDMAEMVVKERIRQIESE